MKEALKHSPCGVKIVESGIAGLPTKSLVKGKLEVAVALLKIVVVERTVAITKWWPGGSLAKLMAQRLS